MGALHRWLLGWEVWVLLHLLVAWFMPGVLKSLAAPRSLSPVHAQTAVAVENRTQLQRVLSSTALPAYHVLMALILPLAIGVSAFGSFSSPALAQLLNFYQF